MIKAFSMFSENLLGHGCMIKREVEHISLPGMLNLPVAVSALSLSGISKLLIEIGSCCHSDNN